MEIDDLFLGMRDEHDRDFFMALGEKALPSGADSFGNIPIAIRQAFCDILLQVVKVRIFEWIDSHISFYNMAE
jgi:hypothetical protein